MARAAAVLLLLAAVSCAPGSSKTSSIVPTFRPVDVAGLTSSQRDDLVTLDARVEQVDDTPKGVWIHLSDAETKTVVYVPVRAAGAFRDSIGAGEWTLQLRVGERTMTPLGSPALEVYPLQMFQSRFFDSPTPLDPPTEG